MDLNGFYDINVNPKALKKPQKLFQKLLNFNYRVIAVNQEIDELSIETKPNKKRKGDTCVEGSGSSTKDIDIIPPPLAINIPKEFVNKIQVLNRLTIKFSNAEKLVKLRQSKNLKEYHLLAANPQSEDALKKVCLSLDFDIITFTPSEKYVKLSRKMYNSAVSKNMFFEIPYAPMLESSAARKSIIQTAHNYHIIGRCKNIILSSGAENHMQIRGPYDIMNLGILFGLSQGPVKNAITKFGKAAVLRGYGRRCEKGIMVIKKLQDESDDNDLNDDACLQSAKRLKLRNS